MKRLFNFTFCCIIYANVIYSQKLVPVFSCWCTKGFDNITVIRALEEYEIPIDYVSGTSIGEIIGALYASGYSSEEMGVIIESDELIGQRA